MIGVVAGSAAMYHAMTELALADTSTFKEPIKLSPPPPGTSVLVLGAGIAGMVAAMELRDAGYKVQILEYNGRAGGRNWSLYGGDSYTELGGFTQNVQFDPGQYINPGPWRLPYHHQGILHYVNRLGVTLEPFTQVNYNAYVHSTNAFDGKPQRYRTIQADFYGQVAELLSKTTKQGALDQTVTMQDREILMTALKEWGALDANHQYATGLEAGERRGFATDPGGGLNSVAIAGKRIEMSDLLKSGMWSSIGAGLAYDMQSSIFQPKGGMGQVGKAFGKALEPLIQYNCKVVEIQTERREGRGFLHRQPHGGTPKTVAADWCVCTIPASVLSQIPMNVGGPMKTAINQIPYMAALKVGLQMKRRFWEQDEHIYGGVTYTNQPNTMIGYPQWDFFSKGKGVLLGSYCFGTPAYIAAAKPPEERIKDALEYGVQDPPPICDRV
jgi:monoamine oxidase